MSQVSIGPDAINHELEAWRQALQSLSLLNIPAPAMPAVERMRHELERSTAPTALARAPSTTLLCLDLFAALLWHEVLAAWKAHSAKGERALLALELAMDSVLEAQCGKLAITRKLTATMREVWALQPRFEQRSGQRPFRLLEAERCSMAIVGVSPFRIHTTAAEWPSPPSDTKTTT